GCFAFFDACPGSTLVLNVKPLRRPTAFTNDITNLVGSGVFTSQPNGQHGPDIWMATHCEHQSHGILIVVTPGKSDDVYILFALSDRVRNLLRALDGIDHQHDVPHSLAAVAALVTGPTPNPISR